MEKKKKKTIKLNLKRDDVVQVMTGKDKGTTGKILSVNRKKCRVIVEGVNIQKKHVKPNQKNPQGGVFPMEASVHYSNVLLFCKESNRGERIRIERDKDGNRKRIFVKSSVSAD